MQNYNVYTRSHRRNEQMAETPEQVAARLRALEQLAQSLGLVLPNQLANNNVGDDPQAVMAKKLVALKPPLFVGKEDPTIVQNWVREFDKIFTVAGTLELQKVDQATFYLRENADTWWEYEGPTIREQENFNRKAFKTAIRARFFPEHIRR